MERENRQQQLFVLIDTMNEMLDQKRWRRMSALHQQLMRQFYAYEALETDADVLRAVKERLRDAFATLIERRTLRSEELKVKMDKHQKNQEAAIAYSMVNLFSEPL